MTGEVIETLSFALQVEGRKPVHRADAFVARIAAERLLEYLEWSGFVVMNKPPTPALRAPNIGAAGRPDVGRTYSGPAARPFPSSAPKERGLAGTLDASLPLAGGKPVSALPALKSHARTPHGDPPAVTRD